MPFVSSAGGVQPRRPLSHNRPQTPPHHSRIMGHGIPGPTAEAVKGLRMAELDIREIRSEFPALEESIYMNTGGTGPLRTAVVEDVVNTYRTAAAEGPDIPAIRVPLHESLESARETVAKFFGVDTDEIAFIRAVSEGMSMVAYGLDWEPGDEVIVTDEEHPSGMMIWLSLAERLGIKLTKLPIITDHEKLLACLEEMITDRTRLLSISHVTTDTGTKLPAADICRLAHEHDIPVLLDAAQSAGQFPINLRDMDCDFYACTGHKWLLGGWGTGIFYIKRDWIKRLKISWTGAQAGTWDRDTDDLEFVDTAHRFEFGGRHISLYKAMGKAIEYLDTLGLDKIEARVRGLTDRLKAAIAEIQGATLRSPESSEFSTGIVTFSVEGLTGTELNKQMFERWRILGRPALKFTAMRLSPAFFTSEAEIDTIISAIGTLANENRPG